MPHEEKVLIKITRFGLWLVAAATLITGHDAATAQITGYPSKPMRFLVGVAPGGGTDFAARLIGAKLAEKCGQPVITGNRTGATGNIALELTAKASPDGYTFVVFDLAHVPYKGTGPMAIDLPRLLPSRMSCKS